MEKGILNGKFVYKTLPDGSVEKSKVICTFCKCEMSYHRSTTSLKYHLRAKHRAHADGFLPRCPPPKRKTFDDLQKKRQSSNNQLCVRLFSAPQQEHTTFYEFRTYSIRPDQNAAFLKLTNEKIHLRTAHSPLVGYWSIEYGGLNKVFHIWQYDSYAQRASVRAALAQDPSWISEYISKALPMLTAQDNEVTYLTPWSNIKMPRQEGGAYELVTYQMRPGGPAVWGKDFQAATMAHDLLGYGKLVGAFHNEFGPVNRVHALWWFESADNRAQLRHKSHTDARVVAAVRNSVTHLESQVNKLMFPCAFSPMK